MFRVLVTTFFGAMYIGAVQRRRAGKRTPMTPVEVAIVWGIIMTIWGIVLPQWHGFTVRARQSEATSNLPRILTLQLEYQHRYGTDAGGPDAFKLLKWSPEGSSRYAYFCGDDFIPNTLMTPVARREVFLSRLRPSSSRKGFTCLAVGNVDNDTDLDYWMINDVKMIQNLPSTDL